MECNSLVVVGIHFISILNFAAFLIINRVLVTIAKYSQPCVFGKSWMAGTSPAMTASGSLGLMVRSIAKQCVSNHGPPRSFETRLRRSSV